MIHKLRDIPQDIRWHPEGDAFIHTMLVQEAAWAIIARDNISERDSLILSTAARWHDIGKLTTTRLVCYPNGVVEKITSYGHEAESAKIVRKELRDDPHVEAIAILCATHMRYKIDTRKAIQKLADELFEAETTLTLWAALVEADHSARPPLPKCAPGNKVLESAKEFGISIV